MHFIAEARDLKKAVKTVSACIEPRNTIPILGMVLFTMDGPRLRIEATDLDMEMRTTLDVIEATDDFAAACPAHEFLNALRYAGSAPVKVEAKVDEDGKTNRRIVMTIGDNDTVFVIYVGSVVSDFPHLLASRFGGKTPAPVEYESFSNGHMAHMIETVAVAVSTEDTRYYLNGVYWTPGAFVATDGHRLVRHTYTHTTPAEVKAIIPRKAVGIILAQKAQDVKTRSYDEGVILAFDMGGVTIETKTIDGTYPDYERVIPKATGLDYTFDGERLAHALDTAIAFHGRNRSAIGLYKQEGDIVLATGDKVLHEARGHDTEFAAKTYAPWPEGGETFGLNMRYLRQFVTAAGTVRLKVIDRGSPILVYNEVEGSEVTRVVMPMRV